MAIKASRITGGISALAASAVFVVSGIVSWIVGVIAAVFGVVAIRAFLHESVEEFEVGLGEIQSHLDSNWRRCARLASWPRNLNQRYEGGLVGWSSVNAAHLEQSDAAVLAIARKFYQRDGVLGEPYHLKCRRQMRSMADWWAHAGRLAHFIHKDVSREGIVMLAYLEIALAEKLHVDGASPGRLTAWANLGQLWPTLCEREQAVALATPTTMAPPPNASPLPLSALKDPTAAPIQIAPDCKDVVIRGLKIITKDDGLTAINVGDRSTVDLEGVKEQATMIVQSTVVMIRRCAP